MQWIVIVTKLSYVRSNPKPDNGVLLRAIEPKDRQPRVAFAWREAIKTSLLPPSYLGMGPAVA